MSEKDRRYYAKNKERILEKKREYSASYYVENYDRIQAKRTAQREKIRERNRLWYAENAERMRERARNYNRSREGRNNRLIARFGITLDQYEEMQRRQGGLCEICRKGEVGLHVDHDHRTGAVRGLLCGACNRAIGLLCEDPMSLQRAIDYLKAHGRE